MISVERVIAPDQTPGQCFLRATVEQVVHGTDYRIAQALALSLACRAGGVTPTADAREPPTIQFLRAEKRALVHLDSGQRVVGGGYYGLDPQGDAGSD